MSSRRPTFLLLVLLVGVFVAGAATLLALRPPAGPETEQRSTRDQSAEPAPPQPDAPALRRTERGTTARPKAERVVISGQVAWSDTAVPDARVVVTLDEPPSVAPQEWSGTSDEDGRFRIEDVPITVTRLVVSADGYVPHRARLSLDGSTREVGVGWIGLGVMQSIVVVVITRDDRPVKGALVRGATSPPFEHTVIQRAGEVIFSTVNLPGDASWREPEVTTDAVGLARFDGLAPQMWNFLAEKPPHGRGRTGAQYLVGRREAGEPVEVVLFPLARLSGRVLDPRGVPVAGARLSIVPSNPNLRSGGHLQAETDEAGRYEYEGLESAIYRVWAAAAPDHIPHTLQAFELLRDTERDFELRPVVTLRGLVTHGDAPVEGAEVGLRSGAFLEPVTVRTDASGRFSIPGLVVSSASTRFWVEHPEYATATGEFTTVKTSELRVKLVREATIRVRLRNPAGNPIPGAFIRVQRGSEASRAFFRARGSDPDRTDEEGNYETDSRREDDYTVTARASDTANVLPIERTGVRPGDTVEFVASRGKTITGRVLDEHDEPLEDIRVTAQREGEDAGKSASYNFHSITGPDGRFRLLGLSAAEYDVAIWSGQRSGEEPSGYFGAVARGVPGGTRSVTLRIMPHRRITGWLLNEQGQPAAAETLDVTLLETDYDHPGKPWTHDSVETDAEGRFVADGLPPGSFQVELAARRNETRVRRLLGPRKISSGTADLQLQLDAGVLISGVVLDPDREPADDAEVIATPRGGGDTRRTDTDELGRFVLSPLTSEKRYDVSATYLDYAPARALNVKTGTRGLRLVVTDGLSASGTLSDKTGGLLANTPFWLVHTKTDEYVRMRTNSRGWFETSGLEPGVYRAKVRLPELDGGDDGNGEEFVPAGSLTAGQTDALLRLAR